VLLAFYLPAETYKQAAPETGWSSGSTGGRVELHKVLPNPGDVARQLLEEWDFLALHEETEGDAVRHVREVRWEG